MRRKALVAICSMFLLAFVSVNASIAEAGGKHKKWKKAPAKAHHSHVEYHNHQGPPPWAPAHGYRRKHSQHHANHVADLDLAAGYLPPFDIGIGNCNRDLVGSAIGAAAGGLIGSQIGKGTGKLAAVGAGVFIGGIIGGSIGRSMDQVDHNCVGGVLEHGPSNQTVAWQNPDTGATYQMTPTNTYQQTDGRYCREYQTNVIVGNQQQQLYGTACRQPDGSWQIIN